MEIISDQKYIHTSPRKLRLVADLVRKLNPGRALDVLEFTPKYAAKELSNAIKTALANAKQKGLTPEGLSFVKLEVNESLKMRRFRAGTRGRVKPFKKRMSHIKIVLSDQTGSDQMKSDKSDKIRLDQKISKPVSQKEKAGTPKNRNTETPISSDLSVKETK